MKKYIIPVLAALLFIFPGVVMTRQSLSGGQSFTVLLAYHPEYLQKAPNILDAYESVLQEEGVSFDRIDVHDIAAMSVEELALRSPVVILPDGVLQSLPNQFNQWAKRYLAEGGNLLVVYDAGVRNQKGFFLDTAVLADIFGLNTITYANAGGQAYGYGSIQFTSAKSRDYFQIPPGKTDERLFLSGYRYGKLMYPLAGNKPLGRIPEKTIYAYGITVQNEKYPALLLTEYSRGKALYVDLPLGYLKANADDLPLRSVIRTFLFDVVAIPHIMNVESGRGNIIINWHIDSNVEVETLSQMKQSGLLRKNVPASFHITAGDFCYTPGDCAGFDACGKGRPLVELLKNYGSIGSHGGWGHNWFAENIKSGTFRKKEMQQYIEMNSACLESITGYKIVEYSAPVGVQPQPLSANLLEELGYSAYYSTGDAGSPPNRSFQNGTMLTERVIAFPIMPFGRSASLDEMSTLDHRTEREVRNWFYGVLSYAARNRTTRLIYSHPNNIKRYPRAVKAFMDRAGSLQRHGSLAVRTMSDYAAFFLRFLKTTYSFNQTATQLTVTLKNPDGLAGICVALPKKTIQRPMSDQLSLQEDNRYYYLTMERNDKEARISVDIR
jgi:hypothetical protein